MKILVIGSGGREHAIAWRLAQSPKVSRVFVAPGNAGTAREDGLYNLELNSIPEWVRFAKADGIHATVVGPEGPLAAGVVDAFRAEGLRIFGPSKAAAQLEASKDFAKRFMARHGIPTARYETFTEAASAHGHIDRHETPVVIKADGLAAGKGVVVAATASEAHQAIDMMLAGNKLGDAGHRVVIEEFMEGEEASFIVMVDGHHVLPLASTQDHKRIFDGDEGPNTGGMGAYSPVPGSGDVEELARQVHQPVVDLLRERGIPFSGVLYAGLMMTSDGPKVLEFNVRFGDPETQAVLPRLRSDLAEVLERASSPGGLDGVTLEWSGDWAVTLVLASGGYPESASKGDVISGLDEAGARAEVTHAGTAARGDAIVTAGGRVLNVTALGPDAVSARDAAYAAADLITFDGRQLRRDIAQRAVETG